MDKQSTTVLCNILCLTNLFQSRSLFQNFNLECRSASAVIHGHNRSNLRRLRDLRAFDASRRDDSRSTNQHAEQGN